MQLLKDIRFWLLLFFLIRLNGITDPPLEVGHNWRQSAVNMVARNFLEVNSNIFYPRIDVAGEHTGVTGMEFPIFNYLIYIFSLLFGYEHWYGRFINLLVSTIGIFSFYHLLKNVFNEKLAFYATLILTTSLWFSFGRKIMPDTFSVSLAISGLWFGWQFLSKQKGEMIHAILFFVLFTFGVLSKLPTSLVGVVCLLWLLEPHFSIQKRILMMSLVITSAAIVCWWYFVWVPHLNEMGSFQFYFMGNSLSDGIKMIMEQPLTIPSIFAGSLVKHIGFIVMLAALAVAIIQKEKKILIVVTALTLAFSGVMLFGAFGFLSHSYYYIPFIPVMALLAGYGLSVLPNQKLATVLIAAIMMEGVANHYPDIHIKNENFALLQLDSDLDKFSLRKDKVVINSISNPTPMYFAHRKGWTTSNENLGDDHYMDDLKNKGCRYAVILKKTFGTKINLDKELVFENENYSVYKL